MCCVRVSLAIPSLWPSHAAGQDTLGMSLPEDGAAAEPAHQYPSPWMYQHLSETHSLLQKGRAKSVWLNKGGGSGNLARSEVLPGWGAAAALLQAVAWEEGDNVEDWFTLACSPDPEECCCRQTPLEEAGGKLHHPAVSALPS